MIVLIAFAVILTYHFVKAMSSWLSFVSSMFHSRENVFDYQQTKVPNYYDALREQDLEELVEEEQTFVADFNTQNVSEFNLNLAEQALAQRQRES